MKGKKKWTTAETIDKRQILLAFEAEVTKILEDEIIKPEEDKDLLKKLFYVQKLLKDLKTEVMLKTIRTDSKFAEKIAIILQVIQLDLTESEEE